MQRFSPDRCSSLKNDLGIQRWDGHPPPARRPWFLHQPFLKSAPLILGLGLMLGQCSAEDARSPADDAAPLIEGAAQPPDAAGGKQEEKKIRLNYIATSWSKVLNDVAKETGSTLVMLDVPPGRYSRQDWRQYNRKEAVAILNRELEPDGFRVVIKDQFLTVMQIKRTRPEYRRPVAPTKPEADTAVQQATATPSPGAFRSEHPPQGMPTKQGSNNQIQQASHEVPAASETESIRMQPRQRTALEIAKQIYHAYQSRSHLEDAGPHGLPAFVVAPFNERARAANEPLFTMEIDGVQNELVVTAPTETLADLRTLINRIDVDPKLPEPLPLLMSGEGKTAELGRRLQRPLSTITSVRQRVGGNRPESAQPIPTTKESEQPGDEQAGVIQTQAQQVDPGTTAEMRVPLSPGVVDALNANLKGDVTIESVPDLDLLIIRGNQRDVEAVMAVIRAIEEMAFGSLPEIHLLKLRFVDSQSLAQLMNDIYQRLTELRSDSAQKSQVAVRVVPVVTPNAVLILAPESAMDSILALAEELDQPVDPEHEVEVFRLKHAVAATMVEQLEEFYEEQVGLGTRIRVSADQRTNSVVVQARPRDLSEIAEFLRKIDRDDSDSVSRMKVFPLQSALAEELAIFLTAAIQSVADPRASTAGAQVGTQFQPTQATGAQEAKSVILEFLQENQETLVRSGLLQDIRFNADPRTNSLLVTAPEKSMPLLSELIAVFDKPSRAIADIKVFQLKNADAVDAVELLRELFSPEATQQQGQGQMGSLGIELPGVRDTSALIPMRFTADTRTNSVVTFGGSEAMGIVEAILLRLDTADPRDRDTMVIRLRNVPAADVANSINQFFQSRRELVQIDPTRTSVSQLLEQEIIVTAEPITNSLIVSATPNYFPEIERMAKTLDAEPPQVVIQALLVEVELENQDEFGVEIGIQDSVLFNRSIIDNLVTLTETTTAPNGVQTTTQRIISQSSTPGFPFNNQPLGNNTAVNPSRVGSQGLSNLAVGRVNNDLGYGGLVLSASSENVSVLIRALAARRSVRILSRPQILALDNQRAQIQVGEIVPIVTGVTVGLQATTPNIAQDPAGIILTVTPRISPEGQIVMEVAAEKSQYRPEGVVVFVDVNTGAQVTQPIKDITTALTTVKVPDSQTIVVGGMITKTEGVTERKVPWLGDIPILGHAFRYDSKNTRRTELLIFLTPRIIRSDADFEMVKQIEAARMNFFEEEAEAIHGPLFGVPPEMAFPIPPDNLNFDPQMPIPPVPGVPLEKDGAVIPVPSSIPPID